MLRDEDRGISLKISFCKLSCSSLKRCLSLFVKVEVGSFSILLYNRPS